MQISRIEYATLKSKIESQKAIISILEIALERYRHVEVTMGLVGTASPGTPFELTSKSEGTYRWAKDALERVAILKKKAGL